MNRFMHPDLLLEIVRQEQADFRGHYDVSSQFKAINDRNPDLSMSAWLAISDFLARVRRSIKIRSFGISCRDSGDHLVVNGLDPCK